MTLKALNSGRTRSSSETAVRADARPRRDERGQAAGQPAERIALLRPGQEVVVIDLSASGAVIQSATRMKPGARTELQLFGANRRIIRGSIDRCVVSALEPIRYEGAIVFDEQIEVAPGSDALDNREVACA